MSKSYPIMRGAGGSGETGGSSQALVSTTDNLRSADTVEIILGICEGPIYGLVDGAKSFYLGDTPLQNIDGSYNFNNFELVQYIGSDTAEEITPRLGGVSSNSPVNLTLAYNTPVTRQTTIRNIDYIDVRLAVQRLVNSGSTGTYPASLLLKVEYKALLDPTWTVVSNAVSGPSAIPVIEITGKTSSTFVKELRIPVARVNDDYQIRVTKLSGDNTSELFRDVAWESFQEIITETKAYNNTAIVHVVGQASDQLSSIPAFSGVYRGKLIKVPDNYNPTTRTYTGAWGGSFQVAYSNNPAWCLYDFIMSDIYGVKKYYNNVSIDRFDIYEAGKWCDEPVPDGAGGTRPRYTLNLPTTEAKNGLELLKYIAGSFNAAIFDDLNGTAYLKVDKDDQPIHVFTKENISEEGFEYSYTDLGSRYNDITVTFKNPNLNWAEDRARVFNQAYIDKNGRIPLDFLAVGTTNRQEALSKAQYKLITANTETCLVSFKTNRVGMYVNPFDVILVCDPDLGYGLSGRIKAISVDRKQIELRDPIYLEAGVPYSIEFQLNDGSRYRTVLVDSTLGYNYELKFAAGLPEDLVSDKTIFTLDQGQYLGAPRPFRVLKVTEVDSNPDLCVIEAININRNKWYDADNVVDSGVIEYSALASPINPPGPTNCQFTEEYKRGVKQFHLIVTPTFNRGAYKYYSNDHSFEVWSREKGTDSGYVRRELLYGDTIVNHPFGLYEFKILGKSSLGYTTPLDMSPVYEFQVTNPKEPPADVEWVKINNKEVYWGYTSPPPDLAGFKVKYHNIAGKISWDDAIEPHSGVITTSNFYTNLIPDSARVILVKAVDDFAVESVSPAVIYRDLGNISAVNIVQTIDFAPAWSGTKVNCSIDSGKLKATDPGGRFYSDTSSALMYPGLPTFYTTMYNQMTYTQTITVTKAGGLFIDVDFEGSGYTASIRETGSTTWLPIPNGFMVDTGDYDIQLELPGGAIRGILNSFTLTMDAEDIEEIVQDVVVSGSGLARIPLTKSYSSIKIVSVIIQDDGVNQPVSYRIMDKDPVLGPQIKLLDSSGAVSAGLIDAQIKGY